MTVSSPDSGNTDTPTGAIDAELFAEAIRGWLLSKHIPFSEMVRRNVWAESPDV